LKEILKADSKLYQWIKRQTHKEREGKLDREKVEKLNSAGFLWR